MFDSYEKNKVMIEGAYKKLKSYYHYNKSFIFMKKKIAEFEYDFENIEERLDDLAKLLLPSNSSYLNEHVEKWINLIDYYVMPKSFKKKEQNNSNIVTSDMVVNAPVNKVNFFIDMPIELHILDSLWTTLAGKIIYDQNLLTENCYGNVIDNFVVYNKSADFYESINFSKNKLFKIYFNQYCAWKNNMIDIVRLCDSKGMNVALISLDIKNYFYSVCLKFSDIKEQLGKNSNYNKISALTQIIEKIFARYTEILHPIRQLSHKKDETVLPIGLFSSMLLANLYLSEIDKKFNANRIVKYYGRYVDDMLVLVETDSNPQGFKEDDFLEQVLVKKLNIMEKRDEKNFCFVDKSNLVIQKGKIKIIYFEGGKSRSLIKKLEKTKIIPSQVNIIPSQEISLMDFEEAAYLISGFTEETKIRDIGQLEINRFGLGCYLTQFLQISCDKSVEEKTESKWKKAEIQKILSFFQKSRCLEYLNNWINVLYIMVINNSIDGFIQFERNVKEAIDKLKIEEIEGVYKSENKLVKNKMKSALFLYFEVSLAVSLAVFPKFSGNKEKHIIDLSVKIRHANLFNHHLVTFPLVNYADDLNDDINLSSLTIDDVLNVNYPIAYGKKLKWTPRFITLDEIFLWTFLQNEYRGGNYYSGINSKTMEAIKNFFYSANRINKDYAKPIEIEIKNNKDVNGYLLQFINLGNRVHISKKKDVKVAIANIGINPKMCIQKLENPNKISCNKTDFYHILKRAYENQVEFVLFPEFYLPVEWLDEVLIFARKTKITVITGLNYITTSGSGQKKAMNNVAVIAPFKSGRSYTNSFVFVREKNDYAPLEKEILALKNVRCFNQEIPSYQVFCNNGIQYGIFLCFEFTDIIARALYKNKVDFLFIPEHNKDTAYFASIIESMTRDLHAFIIQANTSIYGDSRITGPYGRNDRNIVQIKGGDDSDVIIGTIELGKIREYQSSAKDNFEKKIDEYYKLSDKEKEEKLRSIIKEKDKKISIMSARTYE